MRGGTNHAHHSPDGFYPLLRIARTCARDAQAGHGAARAYEACLRRRSDNHGLKLAVDCESFINIHGSRDRYVFTDIFSLLFILMGSCEILFSSILDFNRVCKNFT